MKYWKIKILKLYCEILKYWNIKILEYWRIEVLHDVARYPNIEMLNKIEIFYQIFKYSNIEIFKNWSKLVDI